MRTTIAGTGIIIVGIVIFGFTLVRLMNGAPLEPVTKVPGTVKVKVLTPGRYYVWDNHWTTFEGKKTKYDDDWPGDATVMVRDSTGKALDFVPDSSQSWTIGNSGKTSAGYIDVPNESTLQVDIDHVRHERIVSISNRTMQQDLWSRLGGFGIGLLVGAIGISILLIGLFLRGRRSTAIEKSA